MFKHSARWTRWRSTSQSGMNVNRNRTPCKAVNKHLSSQPFDIVYTISRDLHLLCRFHTAHTSEKTCRTWLLDIGAHIFLTGQYFQGRHQAFEPRTVSFCPAPVASYAFWTVFMCNLQLAAWPTSHHLCPQIILCEKEERFPIPGYIRLGYNLEQLGIVSHRGTQRSKVMW